MEHIRSWLRKQLSNPQVVSLALILISTAVLISFFGSILAPVLASVVIAYLLEGLVGAMERVQTPRLVATSAVWCLFVMTGLLVIFALVPLLIRQSTQIVQEIPLLITTIREYLQALPERYPQLFTTAQIDQAVGTLVAGVTELRNTILAGSVVVGVTLLYAAVYLVLVPLLVFFFLKDKTRIVQWGLRFLPENIDLANKVWADVNRQLANYVRGKVIEIGIVGLAAFVVFYWRDLNYAVLLSVIVGLSVLIPYLGAFVVTLPIAIVAYTQWGLGSEFAWVIVLYGIVQALDGNVLVPLLFSEAVDLHPIAIIVAVLFFGGVWGFWGVFFAIPLATVVNAVLVAWPAADSRPPPDAAVAE